MSKKHDALESDSDTEMNFKEKKKELKRTEKILEENNKQKHNLEKDLNELEIAAANETNPINHEELKNLANEVGSFLVDYTIAIEEEKNYQSMYEKNIRQGSRTIPRRIGDKRADYMEEHRERGRQRYYPKDDENHINEEYTLDKMYSKVNTFMNKISLVLKKQNRSKLSRSKYSIGSKRSKGSKRSIGSKRSKRFNGSKRSKSVKKRSKSIFQTL